MPDDASNVRDQVIFMVTAEFDLLHHMELLI